MIQNNCIFFFSLKQEVDPQRTTMSARINVKQFTSGLRINVGCSRLLRDGSDRSVSGAENSPSCRKRGSADGEKQA